MALLHRSRGCEIREASAEPTGGGRNADGGTNGIGPNHRPPSGPKTGLNGGNATARDGVPNGVGISAEAAATAAGLASLSSLSDDQLPSILDELGKDKASAERSGPSPRQRPVRSVPMFEPHHRPPTPPAPLTLPTAAPTAGPGQERRQPVRPPSQRVRAVGGGLAHSGAGVRARRRDRGRREARLRRAGGASREGRRLIVAAQR